jgi:sugar-specific transcriptional regulator TrmB
MLISLVSSWGYALKMMFDTKKDIGIVIGASSPELASVYEKFLAIAGLRLLAKFYTFDDLLFYVSTSNDVSRDSVVLLDQRLVLGDIALESATRLLRNHDRNHRIVLLMTGDSTGPNNKLFDGAIRKPFTMTELMEEIQKVLSPIRPRGSRIFSDANEIEEMLKYAISETKDKICMVRSSSSIARGIKIPGHKSSYVQARAKGLKVLMITEVTKENLHLCRELMINEGVQLRHLDNVAANFFLWDNKNAAEIIQSSNQNHILGQYVYSNLEQVVSNLRLVFDDFWQQAIPADLKIKELESSVFQSNEVRTIEGIKEIVKTRTQMIRNTQNMLDNCSFPYWGKEMLSKLRDECRNAIARGVKFRMILDITPDSLSLAKDYLEVGMEVRSLPNLKGAFSINESEYMGLATLKDLYKENGVSNIYSNQMDFVEQHRAIFNVLWNIAIPAPQRLKEIEQEKKPEIKQS